MVLEGRPCCSEAEPHHGGAGLKHMDLGRMPPCTSAKWREAGTRHSRLGQRRHEVVEELDAARPGGGSERVDRNASHSAAPSGELHRVRIEGPAQELGIVVIEQAATGASDLSAYRILGAIEDRCLDFSESPPLAPAREVEDFGRQSRRDRNLIASLGRVGAEDGLGDGQVELDAALKEDSAGGDELAAYGVVKGGPVLGVADDEPESRLQDRVELGLRAEVMQKVSNEHTHHRAGKTFTAGGVVDSEEQAPSACELVAQPAAFAGEQ